MTFDDYDTYLKVTGDMDGILSDEGWGRGRRPVINVNEFHITLYIDWLNALTGKHYRLPSESEWEYAARSGGQDEIWAGTSDESELKDYAVYNADRTEIVGSKKPNGLGLYDMSGNVSELVKDCWHEHYTETPRDGSAWLRQDGGLCLQQVIRGGSWLNVFGGTGSVDLRTSFRIWKNVSSDGRSTHGFRLAQDLEP